MYVSHLESLRNLEDNINSLDIIAKHDIIMVILWMNYLFSLKFTSLGVFFTNELLIIFGYKILT